MPDHLSVLLGPATDGLSIAPDGVYVDATYGAGGHSRAILARLGSGGRLFAFDVDPSVHARGDLPSDPRFALVQANFADAVDALAERAVSQIDGILFDFGVSSMQLGSAERGFSFNADAPLDMRMDTSRGDTVAQWLAQSDETQIADAIFTFGEERAARRIAHAVIVRREQGRPLATTGELSGMVSSLLHRPGRRERTHPATKTFQALRIVVNDELGAIGRGLDAAVHLVRPGGRIAAISFHSLEDRIVKTRFRDDPTLRAISRKPIVASDDEQATNPRARSAKLRIAERIDGELS